jgi:hypothetical protein
MGGTGSPLVLWFDVADPAGRGRGPMDSIATILAIGFVIYVAAGLVVGLGFVIFGISTVQPAPVTIGARILLLPGATALWPLVMSRWLKARTVP